MKHFALLSLLAGSTAFADEIVLHNGARFSGLVTRERGRVTIRMDVGTMSFAAVDVASVRMAAVPPPEPTAPKNGPDVALCADEKDVATMVQEPPRRAVVKPVPVEDPLEAAATEIELRRQRRVEESYRDALLSIELDRLDLERARLERETKLELRRQRLEHLQALQNPWQPPPYVGGYPHEFRSARKPNYWPIWGD